MSRKHRPKSEPLHLVELSPEKMVIRNRQGETFTFPALDFSQKKLRLNDTMNLRQKGKRWFVRFTLNGKRLERATGETDYDKALCKIGEIIQRELQGPPITLSEFAKRKYIPHAESKKATITLEKEASKMRFLLRAFGSRKLSEITRADYRRLHA